MYLRLCIVMVVLACAGAQGPTPGPGCSTAMDKKACGKEKGCVWCEGGFGPGSCYEEDQAKFLPKQFYKCKKPKPTATSATPNPGPGPGPTPGPGCSMATEKKACGKEKGCVWCEGGFGPGSCYEEDQAKFLPKQFYKCKKPKPTATTTPNPGPGPGPTPGPGCSMATEKKACGKEKGCVWCESGFGPGSCYEEDQAKFLPKQFFKCKKPKPSAATGTTVTVTAGTECTISMNKKICDAEKGCVWCESQFGSGKCYTEAEAKFLPPMFYKCKAAAMVTAPAAA